MKKISFFEILKIFMLVVVWNNCYAQTYVTQVKSNKTKLWGYMNNKGELIIPEKFEKCYSFSDDGYAVTHNPGSHEFYFINLKGEILKTQITNFTLNDGFGFHFGIEGFKNGMALIRVEDKYGFLNTDGKLSIPLKYDDASDFDNGFATAKINKRFVVLKKNGAEIKIENQKISDLKEFSEYFAPIRIGIKFGFIDTAGIIVIEPKYESVGYFIDGLAWAKITDKVGYINTKGEWVIKPQFTVAKDFDKESQMARIKMEEKWAYVNKSGEILFLKDVQDLGDFSEGLAKGKKNNKVGFFNNKGSWIIEPQFDGVRDFKNGFAAARLDGKWGFIDKRGIWIIQPNYIGVKNLEMVK